jgi:uncharacterized protein (TIGR02996 family)
MYRNVGGYAEGSEQWEEIPLPGESFTPTSDEDSLIAAIIANPADDVARLVYADWLDEHDRPERAEFIRLQCELARWVHPPFVGGPHDRCCTRKAHGKVRAFEESGQCRFCAYRRTFAQKERLERRARKLLGRRKVWFPEFAYVGIQEMDWYQGENVIGCASRGFVESVVLPAPIWIDQGDVLRRKQPLLRIWLTTRPLLEGDDDECGLAGDRTGARFAWVDLRAEAERLKLDWRETVSLVLAIFSLRWPGLRFTIRTYAALADNETGEAGRLSRLEQEQRFWQAFLNPPEFILPAVEEIGFGRVIDDRGRCARRTLCVRGVASAEEAFRECGAQSGDEHPRHPNYFAANFRAQPAQGLNNTWNVTITYRPRGGTV